MPRKGNQMATQTETSNGVTGADIDAMSAKALNQFVLESEISDLPDYFIELKPADKKLAVKSVLFGTDMPAHKPGKGSVAKKASPKKKAAPKKSTTSTAVSTQVQGDATILPALPADFNLPTINFNAIKTEQAAVDLAKELVEVGDFALFHLGGVFARMADEKWYMGHEDFRKCCDVEFNVRYRKAAYLMKIYRTLDAKNIAWQDVVKCGWSKLKELLPILTPQNASGWADKAVKMSTVALLEHVKTAQAKSGTTPVKVGTKTFTLHEDQRSVVDAALADARSKGATEFDSVALELICQDYLGHASVSDPDTIIEAAFKKQAGTKEGLQNAVALLNTHFSDVIVELDIPDHYGL